MELKRRHFIVKGDFNRKQSELYGHTTGDLECVKALLPPRNQFFLTLETIGGGLL